MYKLDKKDKRILFELDKNSRQSINQLSKTTKLSRDVAAYRIKQLESHGFIKKYITIIDFTKFGYQIVRVYLKLQNTTRKIEEEMVSFFTSQPNNLTVYKTDGEFDLAVGFLVKDLHNYQQTFEDFLQKYRTYIAKSNFSMFLDFIHYHRNYLVDKKQHTTTSISTGSFATYNYDQKDLELLHLIHENARMSLLEIAKKLKMTATGVKYKLKKLEKENVIVAYRLHLDTEKLGYTHYKVDLELEDVNIIPSLKQYITQNPNVTFRDITVGGSDFEFDCEFKTQDDFYEMMEEIKSLFAKKIRNFFYYKARKIYKYSYFPKTLLS